MSRINGAGSGEGSQPSPMAPKRSMTPARRLRIWDTAKGLCARCSEPVALGECDIDHRIPLWISRDDSDDNLAPMHRDCHRQVKTKIDAGIIAKIKRILAREDGTRRERKAIPNRGWNTKLKRKLNGKVEVRT